MAARLPSGKPTTGEQPNQHNIRTGTVLVIGSKVVDPKLTRRRKNGGGGAATYSTTPTYEIIGLHFEDAGGAAAELAQRPSALKNANGTFTVYTEKASNGAGTDPVSWIPSITTAVKVRWTIMITN